MEGSCDYGKEIWSIIKRAKFLDYTNNYWLSNMSIDAHSK